MYCGPDMLLLTWDSTAQVKHYVDLAELRRIVLEHAHVELQALLQEESFRQVSIGCSYLSA
jgi:hypothetical protein